MSLDKFLEATRQPPELVEGFDSAREADHRIANNLALIASSVRVQARRASKRASTYSSDEVRALLTDIAGRIDAVGQLHKMLSQDPAGVVDISEHLAEMCANLKPFILAAGPIQVSCDVVPGCVVHPGQVMPIALIVIEMVMNAIKYAHPAGVPGRIDVGCYLDNGAVVIEVCDDGVGLPENFDTHCSGGTGFNIVHTLATQLGATPIFDSDSLGLRFLLVLPKRERG